MGGWNLRSEKEDKVDRSMSYIDEICEMLGIEVDVPFRAIGNTEEWYRIRSDCHTEYNPEGDKKRWYPSWLILMQLIEGLMEVDWTPEVGEKYYYPTKSEIKTATWGDTEFDRKNKKMTGIYKTRKRAEQKRMKIWGSNGRTIS